MKKMMKKVLITVLTVVALLGMTGVNETASASTVKVYPGAYYSTNNGKMLRLDVTKVTPDYVYMTGKMKNGQKLIMTVFRSSGNTVATNTTTKRKVYGIKTSFPSKNRIWIKYPSSSYTGTINTSYSKSMNL